MNRVENTSAPVLLKRSVAAPFRPGRCAIRLVAGWCVLLLYLGASSPLGLGVAALAGSFDHTHQLRVSAGKCGLRLTLHHAFSCATHRHGAIARTLTLFARPACGTDPDHVLQFRLADSASTTAQLALPQSAPSEQTPSVPVTQLFEGPPAVLALQGPPHRSASRQGPAYCPPSAILLI